jgi:E3 ubiquitin-protein ligase DOA10
MVMTNFASAAWPSWSPAPHRTEQTFKKKAINSSKRYHISHSQSFTSAIIDGTAVNGLLLVVEVFTVFFTTSSLYFSCKEKQIVNVTTPIIVKM